MASTAGREEKDVFAAFLTKNHLKRSEQREVILDAFLRSERHLSVDDLLHIVQRKRPDIGRTTVQDSHDRAGDAADCSDESLARYDRLLGEEAELCAVPPDLLRAICWYASGWRQFEPSGRTLATPDASGTRWGCMQLSDHWHPDAFPAAMSDPRANVRYAANLLHWLNEQTGSWRRATVAFFGHDARAEHAGRRVQRYREERPWSVRLAPIAAAAAATTSTGDEQVTTSTGDDAPVDDLYADLAL